LCCISSGGRLKLNRWEILVGVIAVVFVFIGLALLNYKNVIGVPAILVALFFTAAGLLLGYGIHKELEEEKQEQGGFECLVCGDCFTSKKALIKHLKKYDIDYAKDQLKKLKKKE